MQISPNLEIIETALWLRKEKALVINDLHLGYEESLQKKGVLIPKFQFKEILSSLERILSKVKPEKIIINGDLKHEFGTVLRQEWQDVLALLDFLLSKSKEVIIIQGNHDPIIKPISDKRGITTVPEIQLGENLIVHGDKVVEKNRLKKTKIKRIIIGHEHPAITLRKGSKWEKYKCFLKGKWKGKELIVVPSFNPLLEGTDILKEQLLSPFLEKIKNFKVYIISQEEVFEFGKVKDMIKIK